MTIFAPAIVPPRPVLMAHGASLALIWYESHAEISNRHAGTICRPENRRVTPHLKKYLIYFNVLN